MRLLFAVVVFMPGLAMAQSLTREAPSRAEDSIAAPRAPGTDQAGDVVRPSRRAPNNPPDIAPTPGYRDAQPDTDPQEPRRSQRDQEIQTPVITGR